ncbi:MAG: hypothetical protein HY861_03890 [Chlamydiia bacterium]|nr:hypothetical protein [Chlamydiia bacterium]
MSRKVSLPQRRPLSQKKSSKRLPLLLLACLAFVSWFVWRSVTPILPTPDAPPKLYSNQCQQDLTLTLLEAIQQSTKSLHLVMFGLSDPAILKALLRKANQQIPVTVYYDPNGSPNLRQVLLGCAVSPIRQSGFMHQKILIVDQEMVFLGSANMTTQSLRMHDNLVIGFANQRIASFLQEKALCPSSHLHTLIGGQNVDLWILPDPKAHSLLELKKRLKTARKSIRIALFTFTHAGLADELVLAHQRGVDVTVVIDMHSGLGASAQTLQALQRTGVKILHSQGTQLLHHKFAYIDEQILIAGSANWTKSAFMKNSDCLIILSPLTTEQKSFMNSLWRRISTTAH